jgi:uncharacterized OsmC-like protein
VFFRVICGKIKINDIMNQIQSPKVWKKSFAITRNGLLALSAFFVISAGTNQLQAQPYQSDYPSIFKTGLAESALKGNKRTLNDFLLLRREALLKLQNLPSDQLKPIVLSAKTTAEQRAGVRRIRIRGHQIISDSDYTYAGYSLGPGSPESALTIIASDIADTYVSQAALKGVPIDSLGVSITTLPDSVKPAKRIVQPHNILYTIYVKSTATDKQLEELRQLTEKNSPIFNLVSTKQEIKSEIDYKQTPKNVVAQAPYQPGLRDYLKYKRIAVLWRQDQSKNRAAKPEAPKAVQSNQQKQELDRLHVEVDPVTGVRRLHIRYFNFLHDNPSYLAGNDLGPSADEHQLGVITSCITHITEIQAASRNIVLDSLSYSIEGTIDPRAGRPGFENVKPYLHDIHYVFHVRTPHSYSDIVALRDSVEAVCPIYNLIIGEQKIKGRIVRGNPNAYRLHPQDVSQYKE